MFGYIIQLFYLRIVNVPKRFLQYKKKKKGENGSKRLRKIIHFFHKKVLFVSSNCAIDKRSGNV